MTKTVDFGPFWFGSIPVELEGEALKCFDLGHDVRVQEWNGPAPWLGNATGRHIAPITKFSIDCHTCKNIYGVKKPLGDVDRGTGKIITPDLMNDKEYMSQWAVKETQ